MRLMLSFLLVILLLGVGGSLPAYARDGAYGSLPAETAEPEQSLQTPPGADIYYGTPGLPTTHVTAIWTVGSRSGSSPSSIRTSAGSCWPCRSSVSSSRSWGF